MKYFFNFIVLIIIFSFQVGFIVALVYPFNQVNLTLLIPIFLIFFINYWWGLAWALLFAFLLETYSPFFPGVYLIALLGMCFLVYVISQNILTNKSLYSFVILTIIGLSFFNVVALFLDFLMYIVNLNQHFHIEWLDWLRNLIWQIVLSLPLMWVAFIGLDWFSPRLKTTYLAK